MKTYRITITEKLQKDVEVWASSASQAREIVESGYKESEYILDASHFRGVTFTIPKSRDYER
ncbi:MAG: DpnD/PcfM family protein [Clostridiales Family XIII bacterium]|jgi:hypothetical protein|nr:DpnD/PcfM family protein [Clostridiales Family XIII bacterium]